MKAIVLLSGGLDSAVILALALQKKRECLCLSFDYGQRHKIELESAKKVANHYGVSHKIVTLDTSLFGNSSLICKDTLEVPKNRNAQQIKESGTPNTYVPARNTIFLSMALAQAEIFSAEEIYIGPNALDTIYPDCSVNFITAFQNVIQIATKQSLDGKAPLLVAPLIHLNKPEIISLGKSLNVPFRMTLSCYDPQGNEPCLQCDACTLRSNGFKEGLD